MSLSLMLQMAYRRALVVLHPLDAVVGDAYTPQVVVSIFLPQAYNSLTNRFLILWLLRNVKCKTRMNGRRWSNSISVDLA
jgi:hypothetical protein